MYLVAQSCLTLCDLMDCSPPGSSVCGIFQARILEWAAMPSSRGSWRRDWTQVSCIAGIFFTIWATREALPKNRGDKHLKRASQVALVSGKEPACQCRRCKRHKFNLWVRKIPWKRAWQPTPVFLIRELHGQGSLASYSWWGHKELDMTEAT